MDEALDNVWGINGWLASADELHDLYLHAVPVQGEFDRVGDDESGDDKEEHDPSRAA